MDKIEFPKVQRSIADLIEDEEGNMPVQKLLMIGTMVVLLGSILNLDVFAKHSSHVSHQSHVSHSSGSSSTHSSHVSHQSHSSHASSTTHSSHSSSAATHSNHSSSAATHSNHSSHSNHANHSSHSSHSNTAAHSNSSYSSAGDLEVANPAPAASSIPGVPSPQATEIKLPKLDTNTIPAVAESENLGSEVMNSGRYKSLVDESDSAYIKPAKTPNLN